MKTWNVMISVDAAIYVEIEAENVIEARKKALLEANAPSLCHMCSSRVEVGDIMDVLEVEEVMLKDAKSEVVVEEVYLNPEEAV